jgi:hypothetical protein
MIRLAAGRKYTMAKGGKERITPPKSKLLTRESGKLRKGGDPAAGRILAEESVAVRQGVRSKKKR